MKKINLSVKWSYLLNPDLYGSLLYNELRKMCPLIEELKYCVSFSNNYTGIAKVNREVLSKQTSYK